MRSAPDCRTRRDLLHLSYSCAPQKLTRRSAWVVHLGQLGQGFVAAVMKRPAANLAADARQRLRAGGRLETVREDAPVRLHPHDLPGAKLETQKVEVDVRSVAAPVHILAVDDLRL